MNQQVVIIPTYNEAENINSILRTVLALPEHFDVMVVDDNSPDGTADLVRSVQKEYPGRLILESRKGKAGLGTAYIHGFKRALELGYDFIFEMDADFSHNPSDLSAMLQACLEDCDMVIGSRYIKGVNVVNWPMSRVLMSYLASYYVRFVTGMPIADATAGFKCYRRIVLETIDLDRIKFVGYAFQIEMKFLAWKHGFRVKEIPIIFTDRRKGESKMSSGIFMEAFLGVLKMKISSFFTSYEPVYPDEVGLNTDP